MNFKELKLQIKFELKELVNEIKLWKSLRKPDNRIGDYKNIQQWNISSKLSYLKYEFRLLHIAYCEFFNHTPYESIEKPRKEKTITKYERNGIEKQKYDWMMEINDDTLRDCA